MAEAAEPVDLGDPTEGPSVAPEAIGEPLVVLRDVDKYFGDLHVLLAVDQGRRPLAHQRMVVHHRDPDHAANVTGDATPARRACRPPASA